MKGVFMIFDKYIKCLVCTGIVPFLVTGCASSNISIVKTKLPAAFDNGYVYYFKKNNDEEKFKQGDSFELTRYSVDNGQEEIIASTNVSLTPRIYNSSVYYFEKTNHDICAVDEITLKERTAYSSGSAILKNNCYADTGNKFVYLEKGRMSIKQGERSVSIDNVQDFTILHDTIYYVTGDFSKCEFYINKLLDETNKKNEKIFDIQSVLDNGSANFKEQPRISQIDAYDDILYILITDDFTMNEMYAYSLKDKKTEKIGKDCIYEYQVKDGYVYCREKDTEDNSRNLNRYDLHGKDGVKMIDNIDTFTVADDNVIMYVLKNDKKLHVKTNSSDIQISGLSWFDSINKQGN